MNSVRVGLFSYSFTYIQKANKVSICSKWETLSLCGLYSKEDLVRLASNKWDTFVSVYQKALDFFPKEK